MSETAHSPEPWREEYRPNTGRMVFGADDTAVVSTNSGLGLHPRDENTRRLLACVNACAGLSTEGLEAGRLDEALRLLKGLIVGAPHFRAENEQEALAALRALGRLP